jgi:prephenate dehydrogenase
VEYGPDRATPKETAPTPMSFSSIAIFSPGLLGGSLALAIRERLLGVKIRVWARREESVARVLAMEIADVASTDAAVIAEEADLILFCMPVGAMLKVAEEIADSVKPTAIITDVGSVKAIVMEMLAPVFKGKAEFIGSHPMAGSELTGLDAARADLFDGAVTILTPDPWSRKTAVSALASFWETVGCRVVTSSATAHDEGVALISHLPHLAAAVLVQTVMRENPAALDWRGKGFLDTTRVAAGPAPMWAEILTENREALKKGIHAMIENLTEVTKLLESKETAVLEQYLAEAMHTRKRLKHKEPKSIS